MTWRVFYSYSHKDTELRNQIGTFLAPLRHNNKIVEWHDRKIEPGANWQNEISDRLDSAHLISLLISADFLASDYCFGVEVEKAMRRLKRGAVRIAPMIWPRKRVQAVLNFGYFFNSARGSRSHFVCFCYFSSFWCVSVP